MSDVRIDPLLRRLRHDERGLTTVEYVIVLCLIAAAAVGTWSKFGDNVAGYLDDAKDRIAAEMPVEEQ
jgi:Flp pilus assembly pilin Flp